MFRRSDQKTVIAEGLKIEGNVTADGIVKVCGEIEGDLHCSSLIVAEKALITGAISADTVVVIGRVNGPISGEQVTLKPQAKVTGDIHHHSLVIEQGAFFDGRSLQTDKPVKSETKRSPAKKKAAA